MSSKMLIDASHPEETRVVVTKGSKIEDFDFESEHKKQIRGNIYLAKVTRVEPSLQAAFVEYGGNRHGFLPFSEIHPDYYQIPVADREALMREMAEDLAAEEADDDAADARGSEARGGEARRSEAKGRDDEGDDGQGKAKRRSRRGGRRRKGASASGDGADADGASDDGTSDEDGSDEDASDERTEGEEPDAFAEEDGDTLAAIVESESVSDEPEGGGGDDKPKRRSTRRRKAPVAAEASSDTASDDTASVEATPADGETADAVAEEAPKPKRRASRRKKAPEPVAEDASADDAPAAEASASDASGETADDATADDPSEETPKPKRRSSRRKKAVEPAEAAADEGAADAVAETTVDALALNEAEGGEAPAEADAGDETRDAAQDETDEKPAKRSRSRRGRGKRAKGGGRADDKADDATDADDAAVEASDDAGEDADDAPEETGADDALDETPRRKASPRKHYKIQEVIKRRQILLVQVTKEERGNKGAALTTYLSLAGRYSVLMPNTARGGGISRKIAQASDRKRLKEIARGLDVPDGMGVILRTAAAARSKPEVNRDFEYLMRLWDSVRELTLQSTAPALVYEEGDLIKRSIRDLYNKEMGDIVVAGEQGYREARDFMAMLMPSQAKLVKRWDRPTPMLAAHGVEAELDRMMQPQVNLRSGGYIIINQTEALVAIDVNSGRSTREHSIEQTARNTNLEAAEEIARQLKLRDLAGLIVIDFIDMDERRNNRAVEGKLKDALKNDRARIQLGRISSFGLLEMSRQRMRSSVLESTMRECPHCNGTGYLKSDSSIALAILRAIEEQMRKNPDHAVVVRTDAATALSVLNAKRAQLAALEAEHGLPIVLEADATLAHGDVKVERGAFVERRERIERQVRQDQSLMDVVDADADDEDGTAEAEAEPVEVSTDDDEHHSGDEERGEDERGDAKRRRRGRRGGRNRRAEEGDETGTPDTPEPDDLASPAQIVVEAVEDGPTEGVTTADAAETPPDEGETKLKRRRSTRRKAPVEAADATAMDPTGTESDADAADAPSGSASADASDDVPTTRRSSRRRKAPVAAMEGDAVQAEASPGAASGSYAVELAPAPVDTTDGGEAEDDKPRRSTRRRKAPVSAPVAEPAQAAVAMADADTAEGDVLRTNGTDGASETDGNGDDASAGDGDGASVSTRRRTRRVTRPAPGLAGPSDGGEGARDEERLETVGSSDTPGAEANADAGRADPNDAPAAEANGVADDATEGVDGEAKPKKGWWNRGFF